MNGALGAASADDLVMRRLSVPRSEVVVVKALLEAHEGLGVLFADEGGEIALATTSSQEQDLDTFIDDLHHVLLWDAP